MVNVHLEDGEGDGSVSRLLEDDGTSGVVPLGNTFRQIVTSWYLQYDQNVGCIITCSYRTPSLLKNTRSVTYTVPFENSFELVAYFIPFLN